MYGCVRDYNTTWNLIKSIIHNECLALTCINVHRDTEEMKARITYQGHQTNDIKAQRNGQLAGDKAESKCLQKSEAFWKSPQKAHQFNLGYPSPTRLFITSIRDNNSPWGEPPGPTDCRFRFYRRQSSPSLDSKDKHT